MNSKYDANSIETLNFRDAVRKRIEMYMGSADNQGVLQCAREVISNSIDEFSIGFGNKVDIEIANGDFSCRDYARGLPFGKREDGSEAMIALLTMPHTGGKFSDKQYGAAIIGQNGTGLKGVALSAEHFIARSYRDGQCAELEMIDGNVKNYSISKTKEPNGTYIFFKPSQEVYRLEPVSIDVGEVANMCENWSYLNKGLKFNLKTEDGEQTFFSKNGVVDFIKNKLGRSSLQKEPYLYFAEDEEGNKVEIAFQFGSQKEQAFVFTNGLHNINGGTSLTGAKTAITRTINNLLNRNYGGDFVRNSMFYVINAKVPHASFSDQTKTRVNNGALRPLTDRAFTEGLKEFAAKNKSDFDKITQFLSKVSEADKAAERARNAILNQEKKESATKKKKILMPEKFKDCEKHGEDSILIVTEGNSALGAMNAARNATCDALYAIRGKLKNALKSPIEECLENQEVSDIITLLGCGILDKYNPKKLNYGKVAISSDADVDGKNIMTLIATMFMVLIPDFVKEGRLCWLKAPLYRLGRNGQRVYAYDDEELAALQSEHPNWELGRFKG